MIPLLKISRPRFWLYTAGPVLVAAAYTKDISPLMIALFAYFLVPANIFLYGVNDLADRDTDRYNKKKSEREHRHRDKDTVALTIAILISLALFVPIALFANWTALLFFSLFFILGAAYSMPPLRFKARPYIDAASNILYVMPGLGAYALSGAMPSPLVMIAAFSWSAAMHWMSAIPDIEADRKAGLTTSAIRFGTRGSLIAVSLLWAIALASAYAAGLAPFAVAAGLVYPLIPLLLLNSSQAAIERAYWRFPWVNALIGFLLFLAAFA